MLLWLSARSAAEVGDGGVVVGQLLPDRQRPAVRLQASAGWPVCDCRLPMLLWLSARRLRNSVTAGLSSASFCSDRQRLAVRLQRLGRLAGRRLQVAEVVVAVGQVGCGIR